MDRVGTKAAVAPFGPVRRGACRIPQPVARGKSLPHIKIEDRDTPHVPLHPPQDRGTRMHLLCGTESLEGTGKKQYKINMSIDKVLALTQTVVTIQITLPKNKQVINRTMLMKRHQRIAPLFSDDFWGTH